VGQIDHFVDHSVDHRTGYTGAADPHPRLPGMSFRLLAGVHPLIGSVDQGGSWLYDLLTKAGVSHGTAKTVTDIIVRPVAIVLVIVVAVVVAHVGSKAVRRILQRIADQAAARSGSSRAGARMSTMSALAANLWRFFVFVIAVAIILGMIGVNLTPLLASATIIGATLGFGAQLIIRDYLSGFLLTVEDQYGIGDSVTIGAVTGVVEDLTLRVTRLRAADGTVYFVANGDIRLLANTSRGWAHAVVDLMVPGSAASDLPQARAAVEQAAHRVATSEQFAAHCTEPPNLVTVVDSTDTTLTLRVTLHSVPSQRDALTRALREEAVVALHQAELWPAPAD
jgi:small-conductance mechanosensitive channel